MCLVVTVLLNNCLLENKILKYKTILKPIKAIQILKLFKNFNLKH